MRFGWAPLPDPLPGFAAAADADALMAPSVPSPARAPIPGVHYRGAYAAGQRFVVRVPDAWNGRLVVAGTPATRSEFANDRIWSDYLLAHGYAYACSNKGIPINAVLLPAADADATVSYPVPFDAHGMASAQLAFSFGVLGPERITIDRWNDDFRTLVTFARGLLTQRHRAPERVYAVGVSNGGAQVRTLLERSPELVDGGVEWAGVFWTPERSILDDLPAFVREMPAYVASGYRDPAVRRTLRAHGFPPDVTQDDPAHPSLYAEYYANALPYYADVSVFLYGLLIDPAASASYDVPPVTPHPTDPAHLPGRVAGSGLARPEARAAYVPSAGARAAIASFAHTGAIGKPLVSIAGTHDAFITPDANAAAYASAVAAAGSRALHELWLVQGGTHVDTFAAFGYGMQPQAPFAWAAFERLVRCVETRTPLAGTTRAVERPNDLR